MNKIVCPNCGHNFYEDGVLALDGFVIDKRGQLSFDGREIVLRPSGVRLLWLLASAQGQIVGSDDILEWVGIESRDGLKVQIAYLRSGLKKAGAPDVIQTCRFHGYAWRTPDGPPLEGGGDFAPGPGELSDEQWAILAPILLTKENDSASSSSNFFRKQLDGIIYVLRTGDSWSTIPPRYGKWNSVYQCAKRWAEQGVWDELIQPLVALGLTNGWKFDHSQMATLRDGPIRPDADLDLRRLLAERAITTREPRASERSLQNEFRKSAGDDASESVRAD